MLYTTLGRTALRVSRLCLGTMNFGDVCPEPEAHAIMDKALELGINFFDTANSYPWKKYRGRTEEIIGRWLAQGGGRREQIVLATKVYSEMGDGPNDRGCSAYHIRKSCEDSLRRLQTDHLDLFQMHHIDRAAPWDEVWQAMEQLVREGKVLYVGSSNFAGWHLATACQTAAKRNFLGLASEQGKYSLMHRMVELEVLPACRYYGLAFLPYHPMQSGFLAGFLEKTLGGRRDRKIKWEVEVERFRHVLEPYEALCREIGEHPANVALAWTLARPEVTAPIIGPRLMDQLTSVIRSVELKLDAEVLARLDAIFPGPGKEAPEAYGW